jgi:hypothetical protein
MRIGQALALATIAFISVPASFGDAQPPAAAPPLDAGCDMPTSCPVLAKWGVSPEANFMDANHQSVKAPVVGGSIHWDTTPRFGAGGNEGQPCNEEHHKPCESPCGAWRRCEDARGPVFSVTGPAEIKLVEGFGVRVKITGRGKITLTACTRKDAQDAYGVPLKVAPTACGSRAVTVP